MLAHNDPNISVLELGTAKGGLASSLFSPTPELADVMPNLPKYVFSAPTESDVKEAEEQLGITNTSITFKALSIDKELKGQGFDDGSFDIVIASNPLRAQDDDKSLANMKRLLKPGGKLSLVNVARPATGLSMVFRCLAGSMK